MRVVGAFLIVMLTFAGACASTPSAAGACAGRTIDAISYGSPHISLYQGEVIRVCDDGSHLQRLSAHEFESPLGIAVMSNGDRVITSGKSESMNQRLSIIDSAGKLKVSKVLAYCPAGVAVNRDGMIIVGHKYGGAFEVDCRSTATLVSVYTSDLTEAFRFQAAPATNFTRLSNGDYLAYAYDYGPLFEITHDFHTRALADYRLIGSITDADAKGTETVVSTIRRTRASEFVGFVKVFKNTGSTLKIIKQVSNIPMLRSVALSDDGSVFYSGNGRITKLNTTSGRSRVFRDHLIDPGKIAISDSEIIVENHHRFFSGADLEVYDLKTGILKRTLLRNIALLGQIVVTQLNR